MRALRLAWPIAVLFFLRFGKLRTNGPRVAGVSGEPPSRTTSAVAVGELSARMSTAFTREFERAWWGARVFFPDFPQALDSFLGEENENAAVSRCGFTHLRNSVQKARRALSASLKSIRSYRKIIRQPLVLVGERPGPSFPNPWRRDPSRICHEH